MSFITKDMVISKVIGDFPGTWQVFSQLGMSCGYCMGSLDETIENGARMHRISLDRLLSDLNKVAEEGN